jgi:Kinesin motor domain
MISSSIYSMRKPELLGVPFERVEDVTKEFPLERFLMIIRKGRKRRVISKNTSSQTVSRSSCILTLGLSSSVDREDSKLEKWGSITFVDMASPDKSADLSDFIRKTEQSCINKSLINLQTVLKAIKNNFSHVPYRSNKLTAALQPQLSKCAKCILLTHLQASKKHWPVTRNSLDFISDLASPPQDIELNSAAQRAVYPSAQKIIPIPQQVPSKVSEHSQSETIIAHEKDSDPTDSISGRHQTLDQQIDKQTESHEKGYISSNSCEEVATTNMNCSMRAEKLDGAYPAVIVRNIALTPKDDREFWSIGRGERERKIADLTKIERLQELGLGSRWGIRDEQEGDLKSTKNLNDN